MLGKVTYQLIIYIKSFTNIFFYLKLTINTLISNTIAKRYGSQSEGDEIVLFS